MEDPLEMCTEQWFFVRLSADTCDITAPPKPRAMKWCGCYDGDYKTVANPPIVPIRHAEPTDLASIVDIYNASIPGRMATADTVPVTVASREAWFRDFDPERRPLWVLEDVNGLVGWLSLRSFYGRPAYHATAEVGVYIDPRARREGHARSLLRHAIASAPTLGVRTLLGFIFGHNAPSIALFERAGFSPWGRLPDVAELDGVRRDLVILGRQLG